MTTLNSHSLYTVGWICALPLEREAAVAMLDEEHRRPRDFEKLRSDTNTYSWGSISAHNIVIASPPTGEYGVSSAAGTATAMLSSFPEVQFGLMVGIGSSIPGRGRDVRLGDIAVSQPHGTSGGVVQYTFAGAIQGGALRRIGSLDSPPRVLLDAVAAMQAQHARQPSHIPLLLGKMIAMYQIHTEFTDGLPRDAPSHPNSTINREGYGRNEGEVRSIRSSADPQIHYGVIASGNTLIKDAATRNSLVAQTGEDCICFEVEAAGLMNQFPCLVIRGICDYADVNSHTNEQWQRYAAAAASAYAKELLQYVSVKTVGAAVIKLAQRVEALERSLLTNTELTQRVDALEEFKPTNMELVRKVEALEGFVSRLEGSMRRVESLEGSLSRVEALEISRPRVESGAVNMWEPGEDSSWEKITVEILRCWGKRVNFAQPFNEIPMVTVSLRAIGHAPMGQRSTGCDDVDRSGFTIRFWAQDDAGISGMGAVWFAGGR
ncbi:hypothetical protein TWF281_002654 [Arthrobotrys megalospora]